MLRKIAKWASIVAGVLVGLLLVTILVIHLAGGRVLAQRWDIPLTTIEIAALHGYLPVDGPVGATHASPWGRRT